MKTPLLSATVLGAVLAVWVNPEGVFGKDSLRSNTTYSAAYGKTKNAVAVDPGKELPRFSAVEARDAVGTWKVKRGFRLELAANEPQVRDPIALCFDERGRMFVCEMIDYSEMRDADPHLGQIRMLEDLDGDGVYEKSTVFADGLPWPTGLIWANGGLYVAATPDIWRFEDRDGDGKAERRERVFTGFGTGLKVLNVQGLFNSLQWGQDNRVHVLAGGGNRGVITCAKRPELSGIELGGRDFWFDPLTHDFGMEAGGAQYGMSFDDFGRKFGCSNSDHLQHWVYDSESVVKGVAAALPPGRKSIAVDGGAAEVFRISPDEPWRIVRTRLRVSGAVPGGVEGGGRVSGYFTGATGTTIYRGDAYGADFVNNSFTGDAGGQLVHRKRIRAAADGVNLEGERPEDERDQEFAASRDTWVRVVNFANAPDGCLHVLDMYREIIEHPWAIPDEIKKHLDLNSGNDRGRIYRIVPEGGAPRVGAKVNLGGATSAELVRTLGHANGWHRDTAHRLLVERRDGSVAGALKGRLQDPKVGGVEKLHVMGVLDGLGELSPALLAGALKDQDVEVRRRAVRLGGARLAKKEEGSMSGASRELLAAMDAAALDGSAVVRFELALAVARVLEAGHSEVLENTLVRLAERDAEHGWIGAATLGAPPAVLRKSVFPRIAEKGSGGSEAFVGYVGRLLEVCAATAEAGERAALLKFVATGNPRLEWVRALGAGLKRAGTNLAKADSEGLLSGWMERNAKLAGDSAAAGGERVGAVRAMAFAPEAKAGPVLMACLAAGQPVEVQSAAVEELMRSGAGASLGEVLSRWKGLTSGARETAVRELLARTDGPKRLLAAVESAQVAASELGVGEVQSLIKHKDAKVASEARRVLASVIPPSREEMMLKYQGAIAATGEAAKGKLVFQQRCVICHVAGGVGMAVGPDLITVKTRGRDGLLSAIVDPNKEVAAQYLQYMVTTKDGESMVGVVAEDTAAGMTLKMPGGITRTVERSRIKGTSSSGQSLMPEGLEAGMSVEDMADLLTFIETLQ
jgi:putative membrane-bound dehydrogenase-like protein